MKPGAKPKPTSLLKVHGGYRADRHAKRADTLPSAGVPIRPESLSETAGALWDQVVPDLVARGLATRKDTAELVSMCRLWSLFCAVLPLAEQHPTDKEVRCAVTGYFAAFDRVASKFGLTAADNASVQVVTGTAQPSKGVNVRDRASG